MVVIETGDDKPELVSLGEVVSITGAANTGNYPDQNPPVGTWRTGSSEDLTPPDAPIDN
jgi:ABC-type hemin transport system substrate-binding protein